MAIQASWSPVGVAVRAGRLTRRRSGEACSASGVERAAVELVVDHVKTDIQVPRDVPLGPATDRPAAGVKVATTRPQVAAVAVRL